MLTVINDVLDYSKIEVGKMELDPIEFELADMLKECLAVFRYQSKQKDLTLSLDIDPALPKTLIGDNTRITQVITNFLSNAFKFTERGEVILSVRLARSAQGLAAQEEGFMVRFAVKDTGIGLSDEQQYRLFKAFSQADSGTSRKYGGTGLGLAICKRLAELLGGQVGVESQAGKGSTFWFTARLKMAATSAAEVEFVDDHLVDLSDLCLLVAEDNPVNQMVIKKMLARLDIQPLLAKDGVEALALWQQNTDRLDVVLMDCEMPNMDGYECTRRIRHEERTAGVGRPVTIIGLSGHALTQHVNMALAAGMDEYLTKPVEREKLKRALAGVARNNR
jgi:CheY-like chemotaxis protein/two-component sensor histidine kinase